MAPTGKALKGRKEHKGRKGRRVCGGSSLQAWDSSNASLGQVIGESSNIVSTLTSAGYEVDFQFDGTFGNGQSIYYTGSTNCGTTGTVTGDIWLNDGNGEAWTS